MPQARAQTAFQGSVTSSTGSPTIAQGTAGGTIDVITLNNPETIINWQPSDISGTGEINFLPSDKTALFTNNVSGVSDFTVLNRILPVNGSGVPVSRVVALNGTVQSRIDGAPGGKVWFYAPGGIVAGPTSLFSVGSLVLTSNDIDSTGGLYDPVSGAIRFRGAANALTSVEVRSGAQIEALSTGSYVALVAPRVVQGGTVQVNGSAAYVGAEAADITINGGLFDISISAGTTDANGVVHTGSTERPGATVTDAQRVFMVAVPKNNALTMLLSGNVGYDAADSVVQDGSAVVLAAGYDVGGGALGARNATATGQADISIGGGIWQPDVRGQATGEITVRPDVAPTVAFAGSIDLTAERAITLRADQGDAISVGGNMDLTAGIGGTGGKIDVLTYGGSATNAGNGQISVAGAMHLDVSAAGLSGNVNAPLLAGGDATGGEINVIANGGSISAASLSAYASATGGAGSDSSGNATGGSITMSALTAAGPSGTLGGAINLGDVSLFASAGVEYAFPEPLTGGNALGGTVAVSAAGGSITTGYMDIYVNGAGGDASGVAGTGTGGSITMSASAAGGLRGSLTADCAFFCYIRADGSGGFGQNGANGTGGSILIHATDADFTADGTLDIRASGVGGGTPSFDGVAGRGGDGLGGSITVESRAGSAGSAVMRFGAISAYADGASTTGSEGSEGLMSSMSLSGSAYNEGDGGNGTGGAVNFLVAGGSMTADSLFASAYGQGGSAAVNCPQCGDGVTPFQAGIGQGGSVQFLMTGGSATIGSLDLVAGGIGGAGSAANAVDEVTSLAGQGIGGTALLESRGGVLNADMIRIQAIGAGGGSDPFYSFSSGLNGADGGAGVGGAAGLSMDVGGTGQIIVSQELSIRAEGHGGVGGIAGSDGMGGLYVAGAGGSGTGGTAGLTLASGALTAPSLLVSAEGIGGAGGDNESGAPGGAAGNGTGGTASVAYLNEGHVIGALTVKADGQGGHAGINGFISGYDINDEPIYVYGSGQGGAGGAGQGGIADMLIDVDPSFASLIVSADGIGSAGAISGTGGAGGAGTGGIAALNIGFGATSVSGELRVSASGIGGAGGAGQIGAGGRGGDALGGSATLGLTGSSTSLNAGDIGVLAQALGGAGGAVGLQSGLGLAGADGGDALGGTALFAINAGADAIIGAVMTLSGDAFGGAGSTGQDGPAGGAGGSGGQAAGGAATLRIDGGRLRVNSAFSTLPAYSISAVGHGGAGADGGAATDPALGAGIGGNGGSGAGGAASFEASDADFVLGDLTLLANGVAGLGGAGGVDGLTSGGTASLTNGGGALLGPGAQRLLASLSMSASGTTGGRIGFADSSTAAGGGLRVTGPMTLSALGAAAPGFTGIDFAASGNPVTVGGAADFTTQGPLSFAFTGSGALAVAGALTGYSGTGITVSHGARPAGLDSISADSIYLATPGGIGVAGAALRSAGLTTLLAQGGDIGLTGGSALAAGGDLRLFAQGNVSGAGGDIAAAGRVAIGLGGGGAGDIRLASLSSGGLLDMADASGNALGGGHRDWRGLRGHRGAVRRGGWRHAVGVEHQHRHAQRGRPDADRTGRRADRQCGDERRPDRQRQPEPGRGGHWRVVAAAWRSGDVRRHGRGGRHRHRRRQHQRQCVQRADGQPAAAIGRCFERGQRAGRRDDEPHRRWRQCAAVAVGRRGAAGCGRGRPVGRRHPFARGDHRLWPQHQPGVERRDDHRRRRGERRSGAQCRWACDDCGAGQRAGGDDRVGRHRHRRERAGRCGGAAALQRDWRGGDWRGRCDRRIQPVGGGAGPGDGGGSRHRRDWRHHRPRPDRWHGRAGGRRRDEHRNAGSVARAGRGGDDRAERPGRADAVGGAGGAGDRRAGIHRHPRRQWRAGRGTEPECARHLRRDAGGDCGCRGGGNAGRARIAAGAERRTGAG
jgi:hypothetical protein